jgi:lysophospholipase L1-like esterase
MKKRSFKKKLTWITALVVTTCLTGYTWAEERPADLKEVSYDASVGPDVITYDFRLPAFKKGARILFIGDSVTDMGWDRKADPNDPKKYLGHCYVRFALEQINAKMPSNQFVFINRGIQGNTVADLRNRWQRDALDLKPDVLSILIGVNDVAKKDLTVASFETEYRTILEQSRKINPDLKIILLDPLAIKTGNYARFARLSPSWPESSTQSISELRRPLRQQLKRLRVVIGCMTAFTQQARGIDSSPSNG